MAGERGRQEGARENLAVRRQELEKVWLSLL